MWQSRPARLATLTLSNLLLPLAVLVFASGFFPYKPVLPGLATFEDVQELESGKELRDSAGAGHKKQPRAIFDKVVFMVVDALRSDFVYGFGSGFEFTQSLIRSGAAIPFTAHATPPTVTMPRVKALTTGSVPSFLDLILNFAESDTSSSLAAQDTWLAQIRRARGGNLGSGAANAAPLVFYGDDTWLKLFPPSEEEAFFARAEGTSSFFVSDFTEVDNNVTRHLPRELAQPDWSALIMHYLGMDHIGHKTGPNGPNMLPKQHEMDDIVRMIFEAIEQNSHLEDTLLVLVGDHGMNAGGNHGGSGPGETEPVLLFASPKFVGSLARRRREYECPALPKEGTEFHFYSKLEQSDVVPTLAGMMGLPVSRNSLGVYIRELTGLWPRAETLRLLRQNALQILRIVRAKYGEVGFDEKVECFYGQVSSEKGNVQCPTSGGEEGDLAREWAYASVLLDAAATVGADEQKKEEAEDAIYAFLHHAQEAMSDTASSYNIPNMITGMAIAAGALLGTLPSASLSFASSFFALLSVLYGVMMFASSYVEEEQHFWYWLTPAWILLLGIQSFTRRSDTWSKSSIVFATATLLILHRLAVRWNQTGQKHAGEPDIVHTFFPDHHILMWMLIWSTYIFVGVKVHTSTFADIFMPEIAAFMDVALIVPAIVFKLNFAYADSPELVQDLAEKVREWSAPFSLVTQARTIFGTIAATAVAVIILSIMKSRTRATTKASTTSEMSEISLAERLQPLLTLFLMTQTRAANVPLFLALELQSFSLTALLDSYSPDPKDHSSNWQKRAMQVSTTVLLLSHVYYFCMGGSNSISSIDLSNAYNGVADYNILAVGILLFAGNWAAPVWWCSAAVLLMQPSLPTPSDEEALASGPGDGAVKENGVKSWIAAERAKLREDVAKAGKPLETPSKALVRPDDECWTIYVAHMTGFIAAALLAVMAACTVLRTHLFIWTVFSPKYLYVMAWSAGWHLLINLGLGSLLRQAATVV